MTRTIAILLACAFLAGCTNVAGVVAKKGNDYCDNRAESMDAVIDGINNRIAEEGARFKFNGITCFE